MRYIHELIEDVGIKNILPLNGCPVRLHEKNKVNIIALGDVGTTMLTGLRLLGSDLILEIGIIDLNRNNLERLEMEINQIGYPFGMKDLPPVHIVEEETDAPSFPPVPQDNFLFGIYGKKPLFKLFHKSHMNGTPLGPAGGAQFPFECPWVKSAQVIAFFDRMC